MNLLTCNKGVLRKCGIDGSGSEELRGAAGRSRGLALLRAVIAGSLWPHAAIHAGVHRGQVRRGERNHTTCAGCAVCCVCGVCAVCCLLCAVCGVWWSCMLIQVFFSSFQHSFAATLHGEDNCGLTIHPASSVAKLSRVPSPLTVRLSLWYQSRLSVSILATVDLAIK